MSLRCNGVGMGVDLRHGGNRQAVADVLGCRPSRLLDASASLAPWTRCPRLTAASLRDYPDRDQASLRQAIAAIHGLSPVGAAGQWCCRAVHLGCA